MSEEKPFRLCKICKICNIEKESTEVRGRQCLKCIIKKQAEKNKQSEYYKEYYKKNRERILEHQNELYHSVYKLEKLQQNGGVKLKAGRTPKYNLNKNI